LLAFPNNRDLFILTTDGSDSGVGAVFSQIQENRERIVSYYSAVHNKAQRNYSATDKELLAAVSAIEHFRPYLAGNKFVLRTDHQALLSLFKTRNTKARLMRWSLLLQEYDFMIEYLKGQENFSDVLSRAFQCNEVTIVKRSRELMVPLAEDEQAIIEEHHKATGHGGASTMKYHILRKYVWKHANTKINEFIRKCERCPRRASLGAEGGSMLSRLLG
jgi:hypothetical protein